mmetsp:Transcript_83339/g.233498  ORF Transcript_83339/g.233498 Transcript_83339/m.233498 type:complete len:308 (+) Transcript_83339:74-997(+)
MGRKGKGKSQPEQDPAAQQFRMSAMAAQGWGGPTKPPPVSDAVAYGFNGLIEQRSPHLWPVTPLGIPNIPPPLPPLPDCVLSPAVAQPAVAPALPPLPAAVFSSHAEPCISQALAHAVTKASGAPAAPQRPAQPQPPADNKSDEERSQKKVVDDDWTPVTQDKLDRRTFFHTAGKGHTFHNQDSNGRHVESEYFPIGTKLRLQVGEIHFGNPRVRVMQGEPAPLPTMLKWSADRFDEQVLDCAQIAMGDYWVWSAVGIPSNRVLYAMKRKEQYELNARVVEPPPVQNPDEDIDLTYGVSIQGIQLVP